jgi:hypothetical protein
MFEKRRPLSRSVVRLRGVTAIVLSTALIVSFGHLPTSSAAAAAKSVERIGCDRGRARCESMVQRLFHGRVAVQQHRRRLDDRHLHVHCTYHLRMEPRAS